ncbi:asparagine synthetase B family protein [Ferrovibrio sp.]|uniref:asparagine synthetase B family protein n=1 Tax=Ferrovibrio sp. TaxID=1917215 RepID=UPI001B69CC45|nr:asparagine synthetase B family protein [Ferrovibrio sp.]MBP7062927.1 asparagine synthetase B family protein [Ferrovibrio sp.]
MFLAATGAAAQSILRRCPAGMAITGLYQDADCAMLRLDHATAPAARRPPQRNLAPSRLSGGASGTITLLSGALYNIPHLAAALGRDPALSASLLADAVLERWGMAGLARLNGDYALAQWQPQRQALLLASCPMGWGSLHYAQTPDGLVVASRPSWLLAFPEVDPEPDLDALALRLAKMDYRLGDRTAWRQIRRLPPGEALEWRKGHGVSQAAPFWSPLPRQSLRLRRDEDYVEAARELLDRAVAARLPKGEPVLCLLSAGLDSPAVVASAARQHDAAVHSLTVRSDPTARLLQPDAGHFADEWQRLQPFLAQYPGLVAHVADASLPDLALETPGSLLQSRDWPFKSPHQVSWLMLPLEHTMRQQGIATVLSGDAGNVTLSYTGRHVVADQLLAGRWLAAWRNVIPFRPDWSGRPRSLWNQGLMPLLSPEMQRRVRRLRGQRDYWWQEWSTLRPDVAQRLELDDHDRPLLRTGSPDLDAQILILDRHRHTNAQFAHFLQGQSWAWRDPYLDLDLVEFCLALPREQYRCNGMDRRLARRLLAGQAPDNIRLETRIGLQHADWYDWMDRRRDWMAAELARIERSPLAGAILDTAQMRAILDAWPATPEQAGRFPTSHRLRKGLGEALRLGQFILMQEGRND